MEEIKTKGLILSSNNLNDNDKIFTVMTRELGKVTAIAKGVRSHKHKDFAALQNFCYSDMVLGRRTGLYYLSAAEIIDNFYGIRKSVEQMSFAAYVTDVVKSSPEDSAIEDDYFNFVLNTLFLTGKAEQKCIDGDVLSYIKRLKAVFELKTVCSEGFMPYIESCARCGSAKELEYFDITDGKIICKNCRDFFAAHECVKINPMVLKLLAFIFQSDYRQVFSFNAPENELDIISRIAENYLIACLEICPQSLFYLKSVFSGEKSV